jgi:hypothetical protein
VNAQIKIAEQQQQKQLNGPSMGNIAERNKMESVEQEPNGIGIWEE